jgi:D-3-phosphoglycerate dehydrogenase / 2-oxoglutarate reductase
MADVLISENIRGAPIEALRQSHQVSFQPDLWQDHDALRDAVGAARALVVRNQTRVTAELIAAAGRLEIIARAGVGLDNVDVAAASQAGVVVAYTPSQNSLSVAELTIGLMLALARKILAADRHVKQSGWARHAFTGSELYGKTLGVVGLGRIGSLTANRAAAFGMDVLAYDPYLAPAAASGAVVPLRMVALDELLAAADVVSCHLPASDETRAMFNYDRFCRMKPAAVFVNVARGEVVDEDGLIRALREGKIAGAALDVRSQEPPGPGPLCEMDNVILTPHVGAFTHEGQLRVVAAVCRDVAAVLAGAEAVDYANFPRPRRERRGSETS